MPKIRVAALLLLGSSFTTPAVAQEVSSNQPAAFAEAESALERAREAQAAILAPWSFQEGLKHYREASEAFDRGSRWEQIGDKLRAARQYFQQAVERSEVARSTLSDALEARQDAEAAEALDVIPEGWKRAERRFEESTRELERGDREKALKKAGEAEALYREIELAAIKTNYLSEAWALLEQARREKVDELAPNTFRRASELVARAESTLTQSRYDTDEPRNLAREARYEARHAIYLARQVWDIREDDDRHFEELVLSAEGQLSRLAEALGLSVTFDGGLAPAVDRMLSAVESARDSLSRVANELAENRDRLAAYEERVAELEELVGEVETEKSALARRLEAQAELSRTFATVERLFDSSEADVFRQSDDVIIRLFGITFAVGSSAVEPEHLGLLTKVQRAIDLFPTSTVTVEGHTDSFGGDQANLKLSRERAEAIRTYLVSNMRLDPRRITAVGHGEERPIASNDNASGRQKNRRIEIIIRPSGAPGASTPRP